MTIYRFIGRFPELKKSLRRQGRKRRKYGTKANLSKIKPINAQFTIDQ